MAELDNADDDVAENGTDTDPSDEEYPDDAHLEDVSDGCGCTEIWEHLSEERAQD